MPHHDLALAALFTSLALPALAVPQQPAKKTPAPATKPAIPVKRTAVAAVPKGLFPVKVKDQWGYIDGRGKLVIVPQFDDAEPFSEDLAAVKVKGRWGFIDPAGELVIPAEYDRARKFSEGFATVDKEGGWGFINRSGKPITEFTYISSADFSGGLGWARGDDRDGFVDKEGKHVVFEQYQYGWMYPLDDGLSLVKLNEKCGFIDRGGTLVIPVELDCKPLKFRGIGGGGRLAQMRILKALTGFSDGMAAIAMDEKWGYIDKTGKTVIAPQYSSKKVTPAVHPFSEGLAAVSVEDKWGYVDKTGKMVVQPVYDEGPGRFSEGRAAVPVHGKWGYIDASGKMAVPSQFTKADPYANGLARVWLDGKLCYIDKAGKLVWKPVE